MVWHIERTIGEDTTRLGLGYKKKAEADTACVWLRQRNCGDGRTYDVVRSARSEGLIAGSLDGGGQP